MKNGQTKPGYNLQQVLNGITVTDFRLFQPYRYTDPHIFSHSFQYRYNRLPNICGRLGCSSEENYQFMQENGMKPSSSTITSIKKKASRYTPNPFHAESLHYNEGEDYYVCPKGQQ